MPKTGDAAGKMDYLRPEDCCIPVNPNSCLAYRCEDVPNLRPDTFGCFHVMLEPIRENFLPILGYALNLSTGTGPHECYRHLAGNLLSSPKTDKFISQRCGTTAVPK